MGFVGMPDKWRDEDYWPQESYDPTGNRAREERESSARTRDEDAHNRTHDEKSVVLERHLRVRVD